MTWGHVTDVFNWLVNGGITALTVLFLHYHKQFFDLLDELTSHTSTAKDNQLVTRIKAKADTLVADVEAQPIPSADKKAQASERLVEAAKLFGSELTEAQAEVYVEEAYQTKIKPIKPTNIYVGQSIKLDGQTYTLGRKDDGNYTFTKEGEK